ncbi:MAG: Aa3 type cytochrome c oxidase subunit [Hyphomicrobiales bacterium]|nr:Aa3 type cytochrome c oxidase subunit [Hyphomicrobiales bacterium]
MADSHATHDAAGHPAMDYAEHEKTYEMFLVMAKWGTILCVGLLVFMAVTLL